MRLRTWKDRALDGLLVMLVITSIVLSLQAWYPADELFSSVALVPSVKPQPPVSEQQMPDILRPEMILVRKTDNSIASLHTGSVQYKQIWSQISPSLTGLRLDGGVFPVERVPDRLLEGEWIELRLPTALMLSQWADHWLWHTPTLQNGSIRVDRITFYLGQPGAIYLSGPVGMSLYLTELPDERRAELLQVVQTLDSSLFVQHRALEAVDTATAWTQPGLLVPVVTEMQVAQIRVAAPNQQDEEARYFPDLSVVRQIDEKDARSLTDGQRLLRLIDTGLLEYRTADPSGASTAPSMDRALQLAQEWVSSRGGWPQEIVLRQFIQEPGRARLLFDLRSGGPYPVESVGAAFEIHASAQRVIYFSRYPAFVELRFEREQQPIITPEAAVARAADQIPMLTSEPIRSMHLAYVARPQTGKDPQPWVLEPTWVIQAGEGRIYVPAAVGKEKRAPQLVR